MERFVYTFINCMQFVLEHNYLNNFKFVLHCYKLISITKNDITIQHIHDIFYNTFSLFSF